MFNDVAKVSSENQKANEITEKILSVVTPNELFFVIGCVFNNINGARMFDPEEFAEIATENFNKTEGNV